jgi:hypothetical protein
MALTVLPSVRAVKITMGKCLTATQKNSTDHSDTEGCQKGKIIMTLNFYPIQYFNDAVLYNAVVTNPFESIKKEKLNYKKFFIDQYHNSIWQPPKIIS